MISDTLLSSMGPECSSTTAIAYYLSICARNDRGVLYKNYFYR